MKYSKALGLTIQWKYSQGPAAPLHCKTSLPASVVLTRFSNSSIRFLLPLTSQGIPTSKKDNSGCLGGGSTGGDPELSPVELTEGVLQIPREPFSLWDYGAGPRQPPTRSTGCKQQQAPPQSTVGSVACSQELGRVQRHTAHHRESCDENGMETGVFLSFDAYYFFKQPQPC